MRMQVSDVVAGLEWLALNYRAPAVVTMSLGVKVSSQILLPVVVNGKTQTCSNPVSHVNFLAFCICAATGLLFWFFAYCLLLFAQGNARL